MKPYFIISDTHRTCGHKHQTEAAAEQCYKKMSGGLAIYKAKKAPNGRDENWTAIWPSARKTRPKG